MILVILMIAIWHLHSKLDKLEADNLHQNNFFQISNTSISIERVEGSGFAIGDNNNINNNKV